MPGNTIQQTAAATAGVGEPSANAALTCHFELPGAQDVMPTDEKDATDASESPGAAGERDAALKFRPHDRYCQIVSASAVAILAGGLFCSLNRAKLSRFKSYNRN